MSRAHIIVSWLALVVAGVGFGVAVAAYQQPAPRPAPAPAQPPAGVCVDSVKYGSDAEFEQVVLAVTTAELRDGVLVCKAGEFVPVRPR